MDIVSQAALSVSYDDTHFESGHRPYSVQYGGQKETPGKILTINGDPGPPYRCLGAIWLGDFRDLQSHTGKDEKRLEPVATMAIRHFAGSFAGEDDDNRIYHFFSEADVLDAGRVCARWILPT